MSRLPKKIIFILFAFLVFTPLFPSPVLAATTCSRAQCDGDKGECAEGVVRICVMMAEEGEDMMKEVRKCTNGQWKEVPKDTPTTPGGCTLLIGGTTYGSLDLKGFQEQLKKNTKQNTLSLDRWLAGDLLIDEEDEKRVPVGGLVSNILNTITTMGVGEMPSGEGQLAYRPGGALGGVTYLIASLYTTPPASGIEYLADMGRNFGLVQPVYAQGFGFRGLQPLLPLWRISRNLTFLLFIFIFLAVGFAIMFRVKISPQAVISIENALPKIIIALILINFSYAIIGFMIDLVYVLTGAVIAFLEANELLNATHAEAQQIFFNPSIKTLIGEYVGNGRRFASALATTLGYSIDIPILTKLPLIGGGIAGAVLSFILVIALLFACFKLFFSLLMCYINIILGLITSPFQIMFSALPGKEGSSLGKWFTGLLSNILVFPGVVAIFLLADAIKKVTEGAGATQAVWTPPYLFAANAELVGAIISYGLLLLAPKIPDYIKAIFEPKAKVPPVGTTIFAPIGGAAGIAKAPISYPAGVMKAGWEKRAGEVFGQLPQRDIREKGLGGAIKAFYRGAFKGESIGRPAAIDSPASGITAQKTQAQRGRKENTQLKSSAHQAISSKYAGLASAYTTAHGGTPDSDLDNLSAVAKDLATKSSDVASQAKEANNTAVNLENAKGRGESRQLISDLESHLKQVEANLNQAEIEQKDLETKLETEEKKL